MYEIAKKACSRCKQVLPASEFYPHRRMRSGLQSQCRNCSRDWHRQRPEYIRKKNNEFKLRNPAYALDWARATKFGLTAADVDVIRNRQNGCCAGCLVKISGRDECVDHNHRTGRVRGLLCNSCNVSLGRLNDDPAVLRRLALYVESEVGNG